MDLREWLFRKRKSVTDFAKEIGVSRNHINAIVNGRGRPGANLAKQIQNATNGEVTIMELLYPQEQKENE
jgi:transcriptional regulator with XRE-family HTH domain